jgi:hypothetical protein
MQDMKLINLPKAFQPSVAYFSIGATGDSKKNTRGKASCQLAIYSKSPKLEPFVFESEEFSINTASLQVVKTAIEFFVNGEKAFFVTQNALKEAKLKHRIDLIETYTLRLIEVVQIADYSLVVAQV